MAELDNQGTITISQGFVLNEASAAHSNSGTFEINTGGILYLTQSGTTPSFTSTGSLTADSATTITINGGLFDYQIGTFTINSSFSATNNAAIQFSDSLINMGTLTLSSSTLTCTTALNNQSTINLTNSTINGSGTLINSGTLTAITSTLGIDFDNAGTANFTHTCSINNAVTTQPNSTIHMNCTTTYNTLTIANGFTNHGLIYFTNGGITSTGAIDVTSGTLVNAADGTIESTSIPLYPGYGNSILAELDNQGIMTISQGFVLNKTSAAHINSGTFEINTGGTLYLTQSGTTPSFTSTGTLTVDSAATISVNGGTFDNQTGSFIIKSAFTANNNASLQFSDSLTNLGTLTLSSSTLSCSTAFNNQNTININTSVYHIFYTFNMH